MPKVSITLEFIAGLASTVPATGSVTWFDAEVPGFMLEQRASGGATFYYRYRDASRAIRLCRLGKLGEVSLAQARAQAFQMRELVREGGDPKRELHRFKESPRLLDFVRERYVPYVSSRKRSWQMDVGMFDLHIGPSLGGSRMNRITPADVRAFMQSMADQGYSPATCNRMLVLLKHIFNCAIRFEVLPAHGNPCKGVEMFPITLHERYLQPQEVTALFEELERNANTMVGQVVRLLLLTGARKREVLDARWEDVDWGQKSWRIPKTKSGKIRHVPLSSGALQLLEHLHALNQEEPADLRSSHVFCNPRTGLPFASFFYSWDTARKQAGLPELRVHDLRHSFASFLVNAGRSLYEVQELLGHADIRTTSRYAHLSRERLREAVETVPLGEQAFALG